MRTLIVIPARLESTRLPRKLLLAETGKPLIAHVWEKAIVTKAHEVLVVTDAKPGEPDPIRHALLRTHASAQIVSSCMDHPNGTSRAAEAYEEFIHDFWPDDEEHLICIVQGDVPDIEPALIDEVIDELAAHPEWDCATAAGMVFSKDGRHESSRVKTWYDQYDSVAYDFTRDWRPELLEVDYCCGLHIGIYCYRRDALLRYADAGPCEREQGESLEQLRALHIGLTMGVVMTDESPTGIDMREDYDAFVARWRSAHDRQ